MDTDDDSEDARQRPSKSQLKREMLARRDLVKQLVALPREKLTALPLDETIRDAVAAAKKMERGALVRQLRYITGLIPEAEAALIARALEASAQPHRKAVHVFQEVEQWRDALLSGDDALLDDLVNRFAADRRHLRQLVRNASKERDLNKPPKSARLLFRYLAGLHTGSLSG